MKLEDLTEEFEGINEAPPGGWLNTKAIAGKADKAVRTGAVGNFLGKLNKAVNKKLSRGSDMNVPDAGIKDKETDDYIAGKDPATAKTKAPAKASAPAQAKGGSDGNTVKGAGGGEYVFNYKGTSNAPIDPKKGIPSVAKFMDFKGNVYSYDPQKNLWIDPKNRTMDPQQGIDAYNKTPKNKRDFEPNRNRVPVNASIENPYFDPSIAEAPPAPGMDQAPAKPDPKVTQQVAQKATALKGVMGGKGSGAMVAKGLDKVAAGETLPPNIIKAIAPYAQGIQAILSNPQLMTKFKQLMKQAQSQ